MKVLISTCLLGVACKYSGGDNARPALVAALQAAGHELVPVCPEVYGGLPTPRTPAERIGSRVVTAAGADVTAQYRKGAEIALQLARLTGCRVAVLKANSPSCGHGTIYDGTFSGKKIPGSGVAAELLEQNGIAVYTDEDCATLLFLGYVDDATTFAEGHGGGGSSSDLKWGRDDDEDERAWARRCMMKAARMMRPSSGKRKKR